MKLSSFDWRALAGRAMDWRVGAAVAAGVVVAGGVMAFRWLSRPPDPEQIERLRRSHLNRVGRIAEGRVVELLEVAAPSPQRRNGARRTAEATVPSESSNGNAENANGNVKRQVVYYSYSISGVSYETAQDVTGLEASVGLARFTVGQSASVKYDPANPINSILIADNWSGLR